MVFLLVLPVFFHILAAVRSNKKVNGQTGRQCKEISATFLNVERKLNINILIIHSDSDSAQFVIINLLVRIQQPSSQSVRQHRNRAENISNSSPQMKTHRKLE
jgi:hypothetical protein